MPFITASVSVAIMLVAVCFAINATASSEDITATNVVKIFVFKGVDKKTKKPRTSSGTGFVINEQGYIATNHHVAGGAHAIFVLKDGQRVNIWEGFDLKNKFANTNVEKSPWSSSDLDLAIIKVKPEYLQTLRLTPVALTTRTPQQGREVIAKGYPGIANNTTVKGVDVTANHTLSKGEVARVLNDAHWRKGGQTLSQLFHTAPISGGNSGGPLFDECGRVVGVNTAAPNEMKSGVVLNSKGKVIAKTVTPVSNDAFSLASDIKELINILDSRNIQYHLDNSDCLSKEQSMQQTLQFALYAGAAAFALIVILLIYVLRRPAVRQNMSRVVETYSRAIRRAPVHSPTPAPTTPTPNSSHDGIILDGYSDSAPRLIIDGALLNAQVIIGRSSQGTQYQVGHDSVSRQHCALQRRGNILYVRDLGSMNGTFVNGQRLAATEDVALDNGADLKLGAVAFKVIAD